MCVCVGIHVNEKGLCVGVSEARGKLQRTGRGGCVGCEEGWRGSQIKRRGYSPQPACLEV